MKSDAYISKDHQYRYWLLRSWDDSRPTVCFIGLNPSTANASEDDPTIRREMGFARRWGCGSILALNVGAFRTKKPHEWRNALDPIGTENTVEYLNQYLKKFRVELVVAAWGTHGKYAFEQCNEIATQIPNLWCLGYNNNGSPRHPLMVAYAVEREKYLLK